MENDIISKSLKSIELSSDSKKIIAAGFSILGKSIDVITSVPIFDFVTSISNNIIEFREYQRLKMIAHFFENFDSLNMEEKMEFAYQLQSNEEYKDFTEKLLFYLESIYEKDRAIWIGKMAIGLAKNKITLEQFDLSVFAIKNSMPGDIILLQKVFKEGISERVNERYSSSEGHWYSNYLYQTIPLRYWDNAGENQTISKRTINSFISIGLLERELKELRTSNRDLGWDEGGSFLEGYKEIHTFSEIALLIYLLALKTNL